LTLGRVRGPSLGRVEIAQPCRVRRTRAVRAERSPSARTVRSAGRVRLAAARICGFSTRPQAPFWLLRPIRNPRLRRDLWSREAIRGSGRWEPRSGALGI
jgi:hypothetical protein